MLNRAFVKITSVVAQNTRSKFVAPPTHVRSMSVLGVIRAPPMGETYHAIEESIRCMGIMGNPPHKAGYRASTFVEKMTGEQFKLVYPGAKVVNFTDMEMCGVYNRYQKGMNVQNDFDPTKVNGDGAYNIFFDYEADDVRERNPDLTKMWKFDIPDDAEVVFITTGIRVNKVVMELRVKAFV